MLIEEHLVDIFHVALVGDLGLRQAIGIIKVNRYVIEKRHL